MHIHTHIQTHTHTSLMVVWLSIIRGASFFHISFRLWSKHSVSQASVTITTTCTYIHTQIFMERGLWSKHSVSHDSVTIITTCTHTRTHTHTFMGRGFVVKAQRVPSLCHNNHHLHTHTRTHTHIQIFMERGFVVKA